MSKTKAKTKLNADTNEERIIAAARFQAGDRVRHAPSNKLGIFLETHNGFALPECWVKLDTDTDTGFVTRSCNPLDLEIVNHDEVANQCVPNFDCLMLLQELAASPSQPDNLVESKRASSSKSTLSVSESSKKISQELPSTTISAVSTPLENHGILFQEEHPAKTFPVPIQTEEDSTAIAQDSGGKCSELSENPGPDSLSGKMSRPPDTQSQANLIAPSPELSGALPASGIYANGQLLVQPALERPTGEAESLLLPTPMAHSRASDKYRTPGQDKLERKLQLLPTPRHRDGTGGATSPSPKGGNLESVLQPLIPQDHVSHPAIREYMMGFPDGWTDTTEEVGGQGIPLQELSVPLDEQYCDVGIESPPLETVVLPSKQRSPSVESSTSIPSFVDRDGYLALDLICTDGGTQSRAGLSDQTLEEYAEAMDSGVAFPPVLVFYDGEEYWLADGFHRVAAAKRLEWTDIAVEIRSGTRRDAVLYSVGANAAHGLRRTNADKRRAVLTLLNDDEWGQWSDREIARRCSVGNDLVGKLRKSICRLTTDTKLNTEHVVDIPELRVHESPTRVVYRGGKTYSQDTEKIGKKTHLTVDSCQKDGVYMIQAKRDPDLRRFDGEWVVAKVVNEYSITIALRREDTPVSPQFLKEVDPEHWAEIKSISDRIDRLFQCDLDPIDDNTLEFLKRRTCFTDQQKLLLKRMENDYAVETP